MKISDILNYPLSVLGLKIVRLSKLKELQSLSAKINNVTDIEQDTSFMNIYSKVKPFTLVGIERCYALYRSVKYIINNNIQGDVAECGVWRGGSCMLIAYTLLECGITDRKIWLYDTFAGMTKPGTEDGEAEKMEWEKCKISDSKNKWCLGELEEVKENLSKTGYPEQHFVYVKGPVEETIPSQLPAALALLRLDTDWYESTKHELKYLYPILSSKGILLIDDYGAWQGARKATDEYFSQQEAIFLNRVDYTGRLVIK